MAPCDKLLWVITLLIIHILLLPNEAKATCTRTNEKDLVKPVNKRKADSTVVESLRTTADNVLDHHSSTLNGTQRAQVLLAADAFRKWTDTYLRPYCTKGSIAVRHFTHLVIIGEYYELAGAVDLAQAVFRQAEFVIPATSQLRTQTGVFSSELATETTRLQGSKKPVFEPDDVDYQIRALNQIFGEEQSVDVLSQAADAEKAHSATKKFPPVAKIQPRQEPSATSGTRTVAPFPLIPLHTAQKVPL